MSSADLRLILSPQAEDDFADILQYTLDTWGEAQFYAYRTVMNDALLTLQQHPYVARLRPELLLHHRLFPAGQHVIIYRVNDVAVSVSRILHGRMSMGNIYKTTFPEKSPPSNNDCEGGQTVTLR